MLMEKRASFDTVDKNWIYHFEVEKPFSIEAIVHALKLCEYPIQKIRDTTSKNRISYFCSFEDPYSFERRFVFYLQELDKYIRVVVDKDASDVIKILDSFSLVDTSCSMATT